VAARRSAGILLFRRGNAGLEVFLVGTALLGAVVIVKHRGNLGRLVRGEEPRVGEKAGS